MSSFPVRPLQVWRSSVAYELTPINGVFEFEVLDTVMVAQTLEFLREWRSDQPQPPGQIGGFIFAMMYYQPAGNRLWYKMDFPDATALFATDPMNLFGLIRELEIHTDINLTVRNIKFLADVGTGPSLPLMIAERRPISRGVAFEVDERGQVRQSLLGGDFIMNAKIELAQQHYSTGATLLAAEDQLTGILDAAFMQFYLAMETILEAHDKNEGIKNGTSLYGAAFNNNTQAIVSHVYVARHRFFGHAHHKWRKGLSDPKVAFQIAKQVLVARWCARKLIALGLGRDLVHRETRFASGLGNSIEFRGDAAALQTEFAMPT
jgi:hypothetical protein